MLFQKLNCCVEIYIDTEVRSFTQMLIVIINARTEKQIIISESFTIKQNYMPNVLMLAIIKLNKTPNSLKFITGSHFHKLGITNQ